MVFICTDKLNHLIVHRKKMFSEYDTNTIYYNNDVKLSFIWEKGQDIPGQIT